jgi:MOSC domain-containing protein YiiM
MGKLIGIAGKEKKGAEMVVFAAAKVSFNHGIGDDYCGAIGGDRQVTIMTVESWEAVCKELDRKLHWTMRRANLIIEGVDLENSTGNRLKIGNFYIEITGELTPCGLMDKQQPGLKQALSPNWRGGVTGKVISEGNANEGDLITLLERV